MQKDKSETETPAAVRSTDLLAPVLVVPMETPERIIDAALKAGYIPVPCKSPGYVQLLVGSLRWNGDDLLMAALGAIQGGTSTSERSRLVELLWKRIQNRETEDRVCHGRLPDPTPEQAACRHDKWQAMKPRPRNCIECGLLMWDAGD